MMKARSLLTLVLLTLVAGCVASPIRVRGENTDTRRVRFEVAYSTHSPPSRATLDEFCARVREVVDPTVSVTWQLGAQIPRRERWSEADQEATAKKYRTLSGRDTFFLHWSSGKFDEPAHDTLRMAHSWDGDATAVYAEVVGQLHDVSVSTLLLHEWGHNLGLVGVGLEEKNPQRADVASSGGHCPDPDCVMYRLPLAQESFCDDCLRALSKAPTRGVVSRLLGVH